MRPLPIHLLYGEWSHGEAGQPLCFWVTSLRPLLPSALVQVTALIESLLGSDGLSLSAFIAKITRPSGSRSDTGDAMAISPVVRITPMSDAPAGRSPAAIGAPRTISWRLSLPWVMVR